MKQEIHPTYYPKAKIICACGAVFDVGSTMENIHVEICSQCHPFYTGKQKLIDTARRVDKFQKRAALQKEVAKTRLGKKRKRTRLVAKSKAKAKAKTKSTSQKAQTTLSTKK